MSKRSITFITTMLCCLALAGIIASCTKAPQRPTETPPPPPQTPIVELSPAAQNLILPFNASYEATLNGSAKSAVFSPNGLLLATERWGEIKIWSVVEEIKKRKEVSTLAHNREAGGRNRVYFAFSPDATLLASAGKGRIVGQTASRRYSPLNVWDGAIRLWSVGEQKEIATFRHSEHVNTVAFSPNGQLLASAGKDGAIKLWSVGRRNTIATLRGHEDQSSLKYRDDVNSVAFSPDGQMLASGGQDGTVKLWSVTERNEIATLRHGSSVNSVAFSPDGQLLASRSGPRIKLWSVEEQKEIATFLGNSYLFSPDGQLIASGIGPVIMLWSITDREEIATLRGPNIEHGDSVRPLAFSLDGEQLVVASRRSIHIWKLQGVKSRDGFLADLKKGLATAASNGDIATIERFVGHYDPVVQEIAQQAHATYSQIQERLRRELPANLTTTVTFSDESAVLPNNALDAGERRGVLTIIVNNKGKGIGFDVQVVISSDNPSVAVESTKSLGDINPNEKKTISLPLTTSLQAEDGFANLLVETKEKRGFDAQKQQIRIPVRALQAPKLEITGLELNDKTLGNVVGNGNGIPENNETVEIIALVKNSGVGDALGVTLDLANINAGLNVLTKSATLGTIRPGQTAKGTLLFRVPRTFRADQLTYTVRVVDVRGADKAERTETVGMGVQQPILAYQITAPTTIHNGERAAFQILPKNLGMLTAQNVRLGLEASGVTVTPSRVELGELLAAESGLAQPFTVNLPRTYAKETLTLSVELTQSDFKGLTKTETYPVTLIAPELVITDKFFDSDGDGKIEQGERVELELTVTNRGQLEALDTVVKVSTTEARIRLSESQKRVGTLPANATSDLLKFFFTIPRGVPAGAFPVKVVVTHADFPDVRRTLNYTIYEEGVATTVVEAQKPTPVTSTPVQRGNQPPTILPNVTEDQTVYTPNFTLQASVSDDRGISSVTVRLNGSEVYASQTDIAAADKLRASGGKLLNFSQPVTLQAGVNELVFTARDNDNETTTQRLRLNYNPQAQVIAGLTPPFSPVDVNIPQSQKRNPDAVALVIGIEKYQNVSNALYGDRDAFAFQQYLINLLGLDESNIILLTNDRATLGGIQTGLRRLEGFVKPGESDVFVFYSGHGAPTIDGKQRFLIPYDGYPDFPDTSGVPLMGLYDQLSKLNARSVTVFVDACFSGTDKNNNMIIESAKPVLQVVEGPGAYQNLEIFSSSSGAQISSIFDEQRHGMFTYYLLKGMRGDADGDGDGNVTLAEIEAYVKKNVSTQARRMGREQEPMLMGQKGRVLVRLK